MTRAKKRRSAFKVGQGRVPRRPIPRVGVVATIRVVEGGGGIFRGVDEGVVVVELELDLGRGEWWEGVDISWGLSVSGYFFISHGHGGAVLRLGREVEGGR